MSERGLILHWPLTGHLRDVSGFSNHASATGTTAFQDQALYLAGDGGMVYTPSTPTLRATPYNQFTISAWVYPVSLTSYRTVVRQDGTDYFLRVNAGVVESYLEGVLKAGGALEAGRWQHLCMVYHGAGRHHYIDGKLVAEWVESRTLSFNNTSHLAVGTTGNTGEPWHGKLRHVKLSNRAWAPQRVVMEYNLLAKDKSNV